MAADGVVWAWAVIPIVVAIATKSIAFIEVIVDDIVNGSSSVDRRTWLMGVDVTQDKHDVE
jgi:hypothetical protein